MTPGRRQRKEKKTNEKLPKGTIKQTRKRTFKWGENPQGSMKNQDRHRVTPDGVPKHGGVPKGPDSEKKNKQRGEEKDPHLSKGPMPKMKEP